VNHRITTVVLAAALAASSVAAQPCAPNWLPLTPEQGTVGVGGVVRAITTWDPDGPGPQSEWLVAAGERLIPNTTPLDIAAFDGTEWRSLGATFSTNFVIRALATYQGRLIVAGEFTSLNGEPVAGIASYDGQTWRPLAEGLSIAGGAPSTVLSLVVHDGLLYAGGQFNRAGTLPAASLAAWDGTQWQVPAFDSNTSLPRINALFSYNNALIVGATQGQALTAMGLPNLTLGRWTGTQWQALTASTANVTGTVNAIETDGTNLLVGGMTPFGSTSLIRIAASNGFITSLLGTQYGPIVAMRRVPTGVAFASIAPQTVQSSMHVISGTTPATYQTGTTPVFALGEFRQNLVAGGNFITISNTPARGIAVFLTDQSWRAIGSGLQPPLTPSTASTPIINDVFSDNQFDYYGGNFLGLAGNYTANFAAQSRSTGQWVQLPPPNGVIQRFQLLDLDGPGPEGPRLVAGMGFGGGNFVPVGIRSFDGESWRDEMGPLLGTPNTSIGILAVTVHQGNLVASGLFSSVNSVAMNTIARRINGTWEAMGVLPVGSTVRDLRVFEGQLFAIGNFSSTLTNIIRWNGSTWLSEGINTTLFGWRLAEFEGRLIASFSGSANGATGTIYERVNGTWRIMGNTDFALPLTVIDRSLYAGYRRWNGRSFQPSVGVGTAPVPRAVVRNLAGDRTYAGSSTASVFFRTVPTPIVTPAFTSPAQVVQACPQSDVTLTVNVTLLPDQQIAWRRNGVILDPADYIGARSPSLTIPLATSQDTGTYDAIGIGPCGGTSSNPITLTVTPSACTPICGDIDFNNNDVFPEDQDVIDFFRVLSGGACPL
jgi:hypothetical protein